jgi:integrase
MEGSVLKPTFRRYSPPEKEMASATLIVYSNLPNIGWRRGSLVAPGVMMYNGVVYKLQNPVYQIRTYVNRKAVYATIGSNYEDAQALLERTLALRDMDALDLKRDELQRKLHKGVVPDKAKPEVTLADLRAPFVEKYAHGSDDTLYAYKYVSGEFLKVLACRGKTYARELTEDDVIAFDRHLESVGNNKTTRSTRYGYIRCFLRFVGVDPAKLISETEHKKLKMKPKLAVQTYQEWEIARLYTASSERHRLMWRCYRELGLREEELTFAFWSDVDRENGVWQVRFKTAGSFPWNPKLAWKSKDSEERDIQIADGLLAELRELSKTAKGNLVFPTSGGQADIKPLKALKSDWRAARLNCGHCKGCLGLKNECSRAKIKTFRATFLTTMLKHTNLRNVQALAGHSDISTTLRYLGVDSPKTLKDAANAAFPATA